MLIIILGRKEGRKEGKKEGRKEGGKKGRKRKKRRENTIFLLNTYVINFMYNMNAFSKLPSSLYTLAIRTIS